MSLTAPEPPQLRDALAAEFQGAVYPAVDRLTQVAEDLWRFRFRWREDETPHVVELAVRLGRPEDTRREAKAMDEAGETGLRTPSVWLLEPFLVFDWLDGERFNGAWGRRRTEATPQVLAGLLIDLHESTERPGSRDVVAGRLSALADRARSIGDEDAIDELAALRKERPDPGPSALCHGDFRPEHVVFGGGEPAVVGWSRAGQGDPRLDLAIATHYLGERFGGALRTPFLRFYRGTRMTPPDELAWFERLAALIRRIER